MIAASKDATARSQLASPPKKTARSASLIGFSDVGALLRLARVVFPWIQNSNDAEFCHPDAWNDLKRIRKDETRKKAENFMVGADLDVLKSCFEFKTKQSGQEMSKADLLAWLFSTWLSDRELPEHEFGDREYGASQPAAKKGKQSTSKKLGGRPAQKKGEVEVSDAALPTAVLKREPPLPEPNESSAMPMVRYCTWTGQHGNKVCQELSKAACDVGFCSIHCYNAKKTAEHQNHFTKKKKTEIAVKM